jgi:hypothetical protein
MVIATRKRTRRSAGPYGFQSPQPTVIESARDELASRARQLLGREIDFIDSDEFRRPDACRPWPGKSILQLDLRSGFPRHSAAALTLTLRNAWPAHLDGPAGGVLY